MVIDDNFMKKLPTEFKDAVEILHQRGNLKDNYLIFRRGYYKEPLTGLKESCVEVKCTACGAWFREGRATDHKGNMTFYNSLENQVVEPGVHTRCPNCKERVMPYGLKNFRYFWKFVEGTYLVKPYVIDGALCLINWHVLKHLSKEGKIRYDVNPVECNIFTKDGCYAASAIGSFMGNITYYGKWNLLKNFKDALGDVYKSHFLTIEEKELEKTDFKNCKLNEYVSSLEYCHPALYMRLYKTFPNIENLVMTGASYLIQRDIETIIGYGSYYYRPKATLPLTKIAFHYSRTKPHDILGLDKSEYRHFISNKETLENISVYSKNKRNMSLSDLEYIKSLFKLNKLYYSDIEKVQPFITKCEALSLIKVIKYVLKQKEASKNSQVRLDFQYYADFLNMKMKLKQKITKENAYPQDLKKSHDRILEPYNALMSEELRKKLAKKNKRDEALFEKRFIQLSPLSFKKNGLIIRPCHDANELYIEGETLSHCVYTYRNRYKTGKTAIFFIRKSNKPSVPFCTLEFDERNNEIIQNRQHNNYNPPLKVIEFTKEWLKFVKDLKEKNNGKQFNNSKQPAACNA